MERGGAGGVVRQWRWLAGLVTVAVVLGAVVSQAGGAASSSVVVGKSFTLASPPPGGPGVVPVGIQASGLGSDGTVWSAVYGTPSQAVVVVAHAADGRTLGPVDLTVPGGLRTGEPVISVAGGTATFAWLAYDSKWHAEVEARSCTLSGCRPTQTVASWQAARIAAPVLAGGSPMGIARQDGRTVLVFYRNSGSARMMWTQASGGSFGPVRAITAPQLESNVAIDIPVVIAESGGRVLAVWPLYGSNGLSAIGWTIWTAATGFGAANTITSGEGLYSDGNLVAAAVGSGAAIAWIHGDNSFDEQPAEPIWVSRQTTSGFTKPVTAFGEFASGLSLAGGGGVLALAFTNNDGAAMVQRSVAGAPFGAPVALAQTAAPFPTVSVDARGETLVTWAREKDGEPGPTGTGQLAIAPAHGPFSRPVTLGPVGWTGLLGNAPTIHTSNNRSAVVWVVPAGNERGAFTTP